MGARGLRVGGQLDRRAARDGGRDDPGHADRVRAGPLPVPRAGQTTNLLIFLPMATPEVVLGSSLLALFLQPVRAARLLDRRHRPHHVLHQLRGGDRQGAPGQPRPPPGTGRHGPVRQRVGEPSGGSRCRWSCPASRPQRCWRSRCPSTTSSSRTSTRGSSRRSRSSCTCRPPAASRRRPTSIASAMFFIALAHRAGRRRSGAVGARKPDAPSRTRRASGPAPRSRRPPRALLARAPARPSRGAPLEGRPPPTWWSSAAGLTGLWTALRAKERDPDLDVVLLEGDRIAAAASGRNGGFVAPRSPTDTSTASSAGPRSSRSCTAGAGQPRGIEQTIEAYGIDCGTSGPVSCPVVTEPYQVDHRARHVEPRRRYGGTWSSGTRTRPGGGPLPPLPRPDPRPDVGIVDPARLAGGWPGRPSNSGCASTSTPVPGKPGALRRRPVRPTYGGRSTPAGSH